MKLRSTFVVAAAFALAPIMALSAVQVLDPGLYNVVDYELENGTSSGRSVWNSGDQMVSGYGVGSNWSFENVILDYAGLVGGSSLSGQMINLGNSNVVADININFSGAAQDDRLGYCQFSDDPGNPHACQNDNPIDDLWSYLTFDGGTISLGTETWNLMSSPDHLPQVGHEANALAHNGNDGFSMWFKWFLDGNGGAMDSGGTSFNYEYQDSNDETVELTLRADHFGSGDINSDLSAVPLPAPGLMLLSALGMGAFMRRKRAA